MGAAPVPNSMMPPEEQYRRNWHHFEHGADVGVRGCGPSLEAAFAEAARALAAIVVDPDTVRPEVAVPISCTAPDRDILLVDWLNAVIYEMAAREMVFGRFDVHIKDNRLKATARGEGIDRARHELGPEVKGASFTALKVSREGNGWIAQCVVDV